MNSAPKRENIFESYFSKLSKKLLPFFIKTNLPQSAENISHIPMASAVHA